MANNNKVVIEVKAVGMEDLVAKFNDLTNGLRDQQAQLKLLKKERDKDTQAITDGTIAIIKQKAEIQLVAREIKNEVLERNKRAKAIDDEVENRLKQIENEANLLMRQQVENRKAQAIIEANSQAETLASERSDKRKAKATAATAAKTAKETGYLNQLRMAVDALEKEYYQLSEAEYKNATNKVVGSKGKQVLEDLTKQRAALQTAQAEYGKYSMNVGNYASATNMLAINLGQVMKEAPNFAISARIGIMSLTNNLPMLAEAFKAVQVQMAAMKAAGEKTPSMFSLISKSVFGLTGIMSLFMVAAQVWGADLVEWIGGLLKGKDAVDELNKSLIELNKTASEKLGDNLEKARLFAVDYNKAIRDGNKERITELEKYAKKEFDVNADRLAAIKTNVNAWREAFKEYLSIAKDTYYNEALAKKKSEVEMNREIAKSNVKALQDRMYEEYGDVKTGNIISGRVTALFGLAAEYKNAVKDFNKANGEVVSLNKIAYRDIYNMKEEDLKTTKDKEKKKKEEKKGTFDYEEKLREANAKAEEEDLYRSVELLRVSHIKRQEELDKAYKENLVTQLQYNTLSLAYAEQLNREVADVYEKYAKKEIDAITKVFEEDKKARAKSRKDKEDELVKGMEEGVAKARNDVDIAMMYGEESLLLKQAQLDKERELEKTNAYLKMEEAKKSTAEINEAMLSIDKFYAGKKVELEKEVSDSRLSMAAAVFGGISGLLEEGTTAQKIAATAEATINTYLSATAAYAAMAKIDPIVAAPLAAGAAILAGLANVKKIWEVDTKNPMGGGSSNVTKTTVTEKFHTGGTAGGSANSVDKSQEVTATLLKGEQILTRQQTGVFNNILGSIKSMGGSGSITSGVGVNALNQTDMFEMAVGRALSKMPPPVLAYNQFMKFNEKMATFEQNRQL